MSEHEFWSHQPVPQTVAEARNVSGALETHKTVEVSPDPLPLPPGMVWSTVDLGDDAALATLVKFLEDHYIEASDSSIAFAYTPEIIRWACYSKASRRHGNLSICIRDTETQELLAYINGAVCDVRVRETVLTTARIDFLCVRTDLRGARMAPLLIGEAKRRCNMDKIWQAIYTAAVAIPTPVSVARYYHRIINIDMAKAYDFVDVKRRGILPAPAPRKGALASRPYATKDLNDARDVVEKCERELGTVIARAYRSKDEFHHDWSNGRSCVSTLVQVDENNKVIGLGGYAIIEHIDRADTKKKHLRIAYLNGCFSLRGREGRLDLMRDLLAHAVENDIHVFNCLNIEKNLTFCHDLNFVAGTGTLHYYLFNYGWGDGVISPDEIGIVLA